VEHVQLMAEREHFEMQRSTRPHYASEHRERGHQFGRHRGQSLPVTADKCNGRKAYRVFSMHTE